MADSQRRTWLEENLPKAVVASERAFQRGMFVERARTIHKLTYRECGEVLGVSIERARQLQMRARRRGTSPAVKWLNGHGDLQELADLVQRTALRTRPPQ